MRSVGCGLLILILGTVSAVGQARPLPSLDEARNASACDTTRWAKTIAEIKAAEPERDAEQQIAGGNISLRRHKVSRPGFATPGLGQSYAVETITNSSDGGIVFERGLIDHRTTGVVCHPNLPVEAASPIADFAEDETTDALDKWCGRAALVLAYDYLGRFNQRVVSHPAYPHRDLCWLAGDKSARRGIADRPSADLVPTDIPDVATAARFGLAERVAQFIADGADVGKTDMFGFDALRWAVVRRYRPILDLLLTAGGNSDYCAALEGAVAVDWVEAIADIARRCTSQGRRLRFLMEAIDMRGNQWVSPFHVHINGGSGPAVRALLDAESAPALSGSEEVASALLTTRLEFARLLLDHAQAEPKRVSEWWDGLLSRALAGWKPEIVELLLERGARPDREAVPYAVEHKSLDIVQLLAQHGADLDHGRPRPPKAVRTDPMPDPLGRVYLPIPRSAPRRFDPPIFLALDPSMDVKVVDLLLQLGADPNVRDGRGRTPLMVAIAEGRIYGRKDGVGWIERYVPQRLIEGQEDWAHRGVEPVLALLAMGANVGLSDPEGLTVLHYAARSDYNVEIAEILMRHGADIHARDNSGRTPLELARAAKLTRMPELLEAAGGSR